ncbi:hypothetical protein HYFRA_00013435 [Hymenoscyphus fraxineus]|uniref:Major facilitator superfamily (MFS) profile domain-containing protein n=1 Tax=Hymenoscyphus fraxineus TaxID=746836 RepID=A0A9N9Q0E8_9HELO|nr:hypothetical protein HYFRA_00013435 [Hymenoscyphus fraxineus]
MATMTTTIQTEVDLVEVPRIELQPLPQTSKQSFAQKYINVTEDIRGALVPPPTAVEARQRWNQPRINMWRCLATFWSFFIVGMNDGAYGALIPHLEKYYDLTYTVVSLVFLSPFAGYTLAAIANNHVHIRLGQRGVSIIGPLCHLIAFVVLALHPPYPVLVIVFIFVGFGNGLVDAAWSAWLANMADANQVTGLLHCCYAIGAAVAPLVATLMFTKGGFEWYYFYYLMITSAAVELLTSASTFWKQSGAIYQIENPSDQNAKTGRTREAVKNPLTWLFAFFIFGYVGAEVSLGGWLVVFMNKIRFASSFQSGATASGFWAGMAVGRIALSFLTAKLGEFKSILLYIAICLGLELMFWLVPVLIVSAVAVAFLGFFLGPLFPTAMVLVTKMMPRHLHVGSIGFAAAFGGSGGAIFPFIVGAIAQARGVESLQPVILAVLIGLAGLWVFLPTVGRKARRGSESDVEGGRSL